MFAANKASAIREKASAWLNSKCETFSEIMGCALTRRAVVGAAVCGLLLAVAVVLASDAIRQYGWAALGLYVAMQCAAPMVREIAKEGGEKWERTPFFTAWPKG